MAVREIEKEKNHNRAKIVAACAEQRSGDCGEFGPLNQRLEKKEIFF